MEPIIFDFIEIENSEQLYEQLSIKLNLPDYFGRNLDALWDMLTGEIEMPLFIKFINLSNKQLTLFHEFIELFEEASEELEGELDFECWQNFAGEDLIYYS